MASVFAFKCNNKFIKKWGESVSNNSKVYFFSGSAGKNKNWMLAKKFGWENINYSVTQKNSSEQMLHEYMDLMGSLNEWNATSLHWWATHFSSKNRLNSPILPYLQELHESLSVIETLEQRDSLVLLNMSWPVINTLQSLSSDSGYSFQLFSTPFLKLRDLVKAKLCFWKNFLGEIILSLLSIWKAKKAFGKPDKIDPETPVYLIKSFTYLRNFFDDKYLDPFFGNLSEYLSKQLAPKNVLTVALGFQDRVDCYKKMNYLKSGLVHPIEIYLTYWDVIKCVLQWFWVLSFRKFHIKEPLSWLGYDITFFFEN